MCIRDSYKGFATAVGLAAVLVFILGAIGILDRQESRLIGSIVAISCGMFWFGLDYFRRLINAGPENNDEESIKKYYSSSIIGSLIRSFGMLCGFAAAIFYVVSKYEVSDAKEFKLTAIIVLIACVLVYSVANYVEEFLYGKLKDK